MRKTNQIGLRGFVAQLPKGCAIVSLVTETEKLPGKGMTKKSRKDGSPNPYSLGVVRKAMGRFLLNFDYENNVNQQRIREGVAPTFMAQSLWAGRGVADEQQPGYFVCHSGTGKTYLRARPQQDKQGNILKEVSVWYDKATGKKIEGAALVDLKENYLDKKGPSSQGTEKEIPVRVFDVSSIKAVVHNRKVFEVTGL